MISNRQIKSYYFNAFFILQFFILTSNLQEVYSYRSKPICVWKRCSPKHDINCAIYTKPLATKSCYFPNRKENNQIETRNFFGSAKNRFKKGVLNIVDVAKKVEVVVEEKVEDVVDFWWPDIFGKWQKCVMSCPFAPEISKAFDKHPPRFLLYTRNNTDPSDFEILTDDVKTLEGSRFILGAPVKIITHGFLSNGRTGPTSFLREFYNKLDYPVNIISVNWEELAALTSLGLGLFPCYTQAALSTRLVGKRAAEILKFLIEQNVTTIKDIHVIGHSLGAHCSGFICKEFAKYSMGRCSRLTGLDPAGPLFNKVAPSERLDYSDAEFVDIIHTATTDFDIIPGKLVKSMELGLAEQIGHSDFYPNKGGRQPGCQIFVWPLSCPSCSHSRSYTLYAESIQPSTSKVFKGKNCDTLEQMSKGNCNGAKEAVMGEYTDLNNRSRSIYYLETKAASPFALDDPP